MKILIINPFGIGDVIFSTPLIEVLKTAYPDSFIGYVCNKRAYEVIKANPHVNKIFIYEKDDFRVCWQTSKVSCVKKILRLLSSIREERFDVSIDLSLGYQYSMFLKFIGLKKRIGFNYRDRGVFLTDKINIYGFHDKHVAEYYLDLGSLLDIDIKRCKVEPKVYISESEQRRAGEILRDNHIDEDVLIIGLIPGCGASWGLDAKYRRWDRKNFAVLADGLVERYKAKVILLGDTKELEICREIQGLMKNQVTNFCGKTTIAEFVGLLAKCDMVITNDGGPLHIAVGLGTKTVSIFGPVDERVYGPYPVSDRNIVVSKKGVACRPCYRRFKYARCEDRICLNTITVEDLLEASEKILTR